MSIEIALRTSRKPLGNLIYYLVLAVSALFIEINVDVRIGAGIVNIDHLDLIDHLIRIVVDLIEVDGRSGIRGAGNKRPYPSIHPGGAIPPANGRHRFAVQRAVGAEVFDRDGRHRGFPLEGGGV